MISKVMVGCLAIIVLVWAAIWAILSPAPDSKARPVLGTQHNITGLAGRKIAYWKRGTGPSVILLASAGREGSDFNELTNALVRAGYTSLVVEAPGINGSDLPKNPVTLYDLAQDALDVMNAEMAQSAYLIGHAFGNRVVRAAATLAPERITAVVLIGAGGHENDPPELAYEALKNAFHPFKTGESRLSNIQFAFFADHNVVPDYWLKGWHRRTAILQGEAISITHDKNWLGAGGRPMLVLQGKNDRLAPPAIAGEAVARDFPDQVKLLTIPNAGHALLPEQPALVSGYVLDFLADQS